MSCESSCGPLVVTLLTGVPGLQGPAGPAGPQGPPGALTSITGDLLLAAGQTETVATVIGIRSQPVSATVPILGQVFQFNGTAWVPSTYTAGTY
ncbi:hypothetical protein UFOVP781_45 [uncultured Caudovirales phage]|uniref:Collagen triple helix repeat n=1 Tax=uncultured Caudovirales phage TaxID=2100421 RepID=A0A6J5NZB5_9CAUD|nr:hypothetical protein UFOVP279_18 [uncultured Caudovirales phage]CAB4162438.1 hypothetical protein UFOVP781_45 [uncultured Caudovirales phage]